MSQDKLPSRFQHGDKVFIDVKDAGLVRNGQIEEIHFSESQVFYDVSIKFHYEDPKSPTRTLSDKENVGFTCFDRVYSGFVHPASEYELINQP